MSVLPLKTDILQHELHVRYVHLLCAWSEWLLDWTAQLGCASDLRVVGLR